ncbi:MAG: YeeE/YedE family protein [Notoacmeibacter sp.]|nr:YeeE/YedE family protein [Notoacmeibacter sp.]
MTTEFTPYMSILGGALIGMSAVMLMAFNGRIAGMTGILGGILPPFAADKGWRGAFLAGAIVAPAILLATGEVVPFAAPVSTSAMIVSGLIVGIGVTFSSGCTSGHGVCGLARLSRRSLAATGTFMASTFVTVYVIRHVIGG